MGEIGHIQVNPLGERCHCGNFGCLETIAANGAIEQHARQLLNQGYPSSLSADHCQIDDICQAANHSDALACHLINHVARHLGQALAAAVNLFHLEKIIIAGEITAARQILLPVLQASLDHQALPAFRQKLSIVCSTLPASPAIGAFALVKGAMPEGGLLQRLLDKSL